MPIESVKCKLCRREGEKLYLRGERCFSAKCAIVKRNYPPGVHGPKGKPRLTIYGKELREKQKAKRVYHLGEKQFRNIVQKSMRQKGKGEAGENILHALELRLDNVIYRLGLAISRRMARQMVNHGHFAVNNKKVNIPSYRLREGDVVSIRENRAKLAPFKDAGLRLEKHKIPSWLSLDFKKLQAKVLNKPRIAELEQIFDTKFIIEHYSR